MMPVVYCIGCAHYKPNDDVWCERPDRDDCKRREYYCTYIGEELYELYPSEYKPIPEK